MIEWSGINVKGIKTFLFQKIESKLKMLHFTAEGCKASSFAVYHQNQVQPFIIIYNCLNTFNDMLNTISMTQSCIKDNAIHPLLFSERTYQFLD